MVAGCKVEVASVERFKIWKDLMKPNKEKVIHLLETHLDIFAWELKDLLGVDPSIITHKLDVLPRSKMVKQKKRTIALEKK